ncbi:hypothetical protein PAECIP111893_00258 [Paenibacillus plantiphilus]|uniref:DUF2634 domain-containing protein n=1 Tax=Paenibacillus plantiphilus TaxID=2905650 RepID=A0ABN8FQF9_9BACL|nr:DUF2634 domain-containing protein [Paenibacillus plantiphilus]CAH1190288.1 hypothetical protein PAECIP111893_00258 [Paenibacillus plantiphilus]
MQSLKLIDGDLVFDGGELQMIDGPEELAQSVRIALGTNKGEWWLDPDFGIDFSLFFGKDLSQEEMREEIRQALHQNDWISTVEDITIVADRIARKQSISFIATALSGDTITGEVMIDA